MLRPGMGQPRRPASAPGAPRRGSTSLAALSLDEDGAPCLASPMGVRGIGNDWHRNQREKRPR
jgi:hypothetical protein